MNKKEKEIAKAQLSSEEKTLKELQQVFKKARQDVQEKISELNARTDMQNLQSIIYQKKYQQAILNQINEALADLKSGQYKTVEEYLTESYDNGYIGMMYSLQSQGIPMTVPINDRNVVKALTTDSKLSSNYYKSNPLKGRLAEDVDLLKDRIRSNLSRGIVAGKSWLDVAVEIASGMNNPFDIALKDSMRIVRTEGHRVHQQGFLDAGDKAKEKGADIVKQWDATMDSKTRPAHQKADGQIVEWDEYFTVDGEKMKAPSVGGSARNVCNCRCQLLQRARWALDEAELETLQKRAEFFGLDKSESFEDYKQKYLKLPEKADTIKLVDLEDLKKTTTKFKGAMSEEDYEAYLKILQQNPEIAKLYSHADEIPLIEFNRDKAEYWFEQKHLWFNYPEQDYVDWGMSRYRTISHEYGHYVDRFKLKGYIKDDHNLTWSEIETITSKISKKYIDGWKMGTRYLSNSDQFLSAMRKDFEKILSEGKINSYCRTSEKKLVTTVSIQDAIDGWGLDRIWWGHGDKYYNREYNNLIWYEKNTPSRFKTEQKPTLALKEIYTDLGFDASSQAKVKKISRQYDTASELWANCVSAETTGGGELETLKEQFPETYEAFKNILKVVG